MTPRSDTELRELARTLAASNPALRRERLAGLDAASAAAVQRWMALFEQQTRHGAPGSSATDASRDEAGPDHAGDGVRQFGPFRLLRLLGEGGMGTVYLAEQARPRRPVALKLIRTGALSPELVARFRREAEFLAQLSHPGIAQVFEAGEQDTPAGPVPYLAMEYVEGEPLRPHCERHALDDRARLALVARLARAVHHAHVRGVVHRDLKPANVLVDAQGQPRILDFGIAKAVDEVADAPRLTRMGDMVGTLHYMSPEQLAGDSRRVDQRSDVYALGVILYELLAGSHPHALGNSSLIEAARIVQEQPARALARARPGLPADVDTLVMKALEPEPDRRYQSAAELAEDIERFLGDRPILARPPSPGYLLGKALRRHRVAAVAAALVLASLVGATVVSMRFAWSEAAARAESDQRAETNAAVSRFLTDMLSSADPERALGQSLTVREALDRAADSAEATLAAQPAVRAQVLGTLAASYRSLGDPERALALFDAALALSGRTLAEASVQLQLGRIGAGLDAGQAEALLPGIEQLDAALRGARGAHDVQRLAARMEHGRALLGLGRNPEAMAAFREVLQATQVAGDALDPEVAIQARHNLASALRTTGEYAESERVLRELLDIRTARHGPDHPLSLYTRNNLAAAIQMQGREAEAEAEFRAVLEARRRVLGDSHLSTLTTAQNLANLLLQQQRHAEAEPLVRETAAVTERVLGAAHPRTQMAINSLAYLLEDLGQLDEAETLHRRMLAIQDARRAAGEAIDSELLATRNNLAMLLTRKGALAEAEQEFARLLSAARATLPESHVYIAMFRSNHGHLLNARGRPAEARAELEAAYPVLEAALGASHRRTRDAAARLAASLGALGDRAGADRYAALAVAADEG